MARMMVRHRLAAIWMLALCALATPAQAQTPVAIDSSSWVDDDARPIDQPAFREDKLYAHAVREAIIEPISRAFDVPDKLIWFAGLLGADTQHQAANVNAFDEVSNSTWFTNRNHVRAITPDAIRLGWKGEDLRPQFPWSIRSAKKGGVNPGFVIRDAAGKRWVVKLDPKGHPQLGSGADAIVTRLMWAAGFNVPHDVPVTFRPGDLTIDSAVVRGKDGARPFGYADLDTLLRRGAVGADGLQYGQASLYVEGVPIGHIRMRARRPDDANDLYIHRDRRELRGLFVLMSWLQSWDMKDHQTHQAFVPTPGADGQGVTKRYLLDLGGSLGAAAEGPKQPWKAYENSLDWGWVARRAFTLGFIEEPYKKIPQDTGIPSVGNFDADHYEPEDFRPLQPHPAFSRRTLRDAYWGAKIVASFNDAQIAAAVDAAGYEDPRAKPAVLSRLIERRDRVARHWFAKVAPLDFFVVSEGALRFRDLAVDRGYASARAYEVKLGDVSGASPADRSFDLDATALPLSRLGEASAVEVEFRVRDLGAEPVRVRLERRGAEWVIALVRHA